ncbi:hypothetical protein BST61_g167 [Cercospora zeina]
MKPSVRGAARVPRVGNIPKAKGEAIYAYCNIRTNQVLYSMERALRNSHLKQLAVAGANNNPPKIRKDIWRPLFTVHLPDRIQGLDLFRSLREYRMMHETNWELPEAIKQPYTEKHIEKLREKMNNRGGSKKETVYDVIKRRKKNMRARMVMDQKANSVADLAAILLRQQTRSGYVAGHKKRLLFIRKESNIEEIVSLEKQYGHRGTTAVDKMIAKLVARAKEAGAKSRDRSTTTREQRKEQYLKAQETRQAAAKARLKKLKIEWAVQAVKKAKQMAAAERASREQAAIAKEEAAKEANGPDYKPPPREPTEVDYKSFIETYPAELDPLRALFEGRAFDKQSPLHTLTPAQKGDLNIMKRPVFAKRGITVQWADVLDSEYAEEWPAKVKHLNMGFVRNTAPMAGTEGIHEVSEFKGQSRAANWDATESEEDAVGDEGGFFAEAQAVGQKQEDSRRAVLEEIKKQVLEDVKTVSGIPTSRWPSQMSKLHQKRTTAARRQQKQSRTQSAAVEETLPVEPTSSENAPSL